MCAWCLRTGGVGSPGTGVAGSCEPPFGCRESNTGPLEEEPVLLTTGSFLQPLLPLFRFDFSVAKNDLLNSTDLLTPPS